jgi:hypothetical protein
LIQKEQTEFLLQYDFDNGSLPPPYHYEFCIRIKAQGAGRISFLPDYPSADTPCWEERFPVSAEKLEELLNLLVQKEALRDHWPLQEEPVTGGEWQRLEITLEGKKFVVPDGVEHRTGEELNEIFALVRALVPQQIWQSLKDRRSVYEENAETE